MASVTVRGSSHTSVQPDKVVVSLGLTHVDKDPNAALDHVAERSQRLEAVLTGLGIDRAQWVTDGVGVGEEWQWRNDQNVLVGYRAASGVSATLRDLSLVGDLLRAAVGECAASVRGLVWLVDPDNPARRALLGAAAADARVRAEAYTEALGVRLGELELIDESPIVSAPAPVVETAMYARSAMDAGGGGSVAVSPGQVELSAAVYVRFAVLA